MRSVMLVALLACAGTSGSYAQRDSDADSESKIVAMEHVWAQAYIIKDPKALERILDDAFVCVASDGRLLTKAQILMDVKSSNALQVLTESMAVHLHGDTAIVTGTFRTMGMERGKPFTRRERFVDTWVYKSERWVSITTMVNFTDD
ncbi:MAG: nuclear transport factor 2 family protein [Candidatus Sulfotelmatobacter sp.]